jgi:hypothetical protein
MNMLIEVDLNVAHDEPVLSLFTGLINPTVRTLKFHSVVTTKFVTPCDCVLAVNEEGETWL